MSHFRGRHPISTIKHVQTIYPKKVAWGGWHMREGHILLIKVDANYPPGLIRAMVRYHEMREDYYMHNKGLSYHQAHHAANKDEKAKFGQHAFNEEVGYTQRVLKQGD